MLTHRCVVMLQPVVAVLHAVPTTYIAGCEIFQKQNLLKHAYQQTWTDSRFLNCLANYLLLSLWVCQVSQSKCPVLKSRQVSACMCVSNLLIPEFHYL